ncbi:hypothetical protein K492DRAFT_179996 [Lichtheimia hyalospora FSU 10163]|nr:hypothetical protein K492DRAFT_179996 [Lichtheimia hyalospora FSU 10163]
MLILLLLKVAETCLLRVVGGEHGPDTSTRHTTLIQLDLIECYNSISLMDVLHEMGGSVESEQEQAVDWFFKLDWSCRLLMGKVERKCGTKKLDTQEIRVKSAKLTFIYVDNNLQLDSWE